MNTRTLITQMRVALQYLAPEYTYAITTIEEALE